jgi:hypothetical protein
LDYRIIDAKDVSLQILANELTQKRLAKNEFRLANAIDVRGKKLDETVSAEELLLRRQELADNVKIANLAMADQINFSLVELSIYQRQSIKREIVFNEKNIYAYKQSFGSRLSEAFQQGGNTLGDFVIFLIKIWWLILLAILAFLLYKLIKLNKEKGEDFEIEKIEKK